MNTPQFALLWLLLQPAWLWSAPQWSSQPEQTCIDIYLEVGHSVYLEKGNTEATEEFVRGLFDEVAALYEQESIRLRLAGLHLWETPDPYTGKSSSVLLSQFQRQRRSFEGDLAILLTYNIPDGMAVMEGLCRTVPALRMGVAGIRPDYAAFPAYSSSVYNLAHQIGHQLGSQHTNACVWNGGNSAIDASQGFTEGDCPLPAGDPVSATLMYSCTPPSGGIDFRWGLGQQAGDLLRRKVAEAAGCVSSCPVPEKDDPDTVCVRRYYLDLTLDYFATETSWRLENQTGDTIASGSGYPNNAEEVTVRDTFCLPEGCYTFYIQDLYGDGICCEYGKGQFVLYDEGGDTIAVADEFGAQEKVEFCTPLESSSVTRPLLRHRKYEKAPSRLRLAPNPASTVVRLATQLPEEGTVRILLYDLAGRRIQMSRDRAYAGPWQTEMRLENLPPGVYILRLEQGAFRQTERLLISR